LTPNLYTLILKKIVFIISIALSLFACKDDNTQADTNTSADSLGLKQKKIIKLSDDELVAKLLRTKNNALSTADSVYYKEVIKRPSDSSFTAINLYGKTKIDNALKEFKQTAIIQGQQ